MTADRVSRRGWVLVALVAVVGVVAQVVAGSTVVAEHRTVPPAMATLSNRDDGPVAVPERGGSGRVQIGTAAPSPTSTRGQSLADVDRAELDLIDPWAITEDAIPDDGRGKILGIAHVVAAGAVVWTTPAGEPVGLLPGITLMSDTATPVLERRGDWIRVMLPSRLAMPSSGNQVNGATGWIHLDEVTKVAAPDYRVVVDLQVHTVTVHGPDGDVTVPTRHGGDATPTPVGRTFVASHWTEQSTTPKVAALGAHSPTLDTFDGGPAVVAIHVFTGDTTQGVGSNGCVRLHPDDWEDAGIGSLPIGTPVFVLGE